MINFESFVFRPLFVCYIKQIFAPSRLHRVLTQFSPICWSNIKDLLQDGKITVDEFKIAVQQCCFGRRYEDFPQAMKMFIDSNFKMLDLNDDGVVDADEYRFNCITKFAIDDVDIVDEAFNNMLNVSCKE